MIWKKETNADSGNGRSFLDSPAFSRTVVASIALFLLLRTAYLIYATWGFNTDDAYITLRYSRHLAEGHGITWNVGEQPVEGYSNFLFVVLGAAAIKMGAEPILFFKVLCCLALIVTCVLLYRLTRPWAGPIGSTLPAMMLTFYSGTIFWTVSGLETAFYQMLVVASVAAFFEAFGAPRRSERPDISGDPWSVRWLALTGVLVCLAGLTRPEGPLIGIAIGAALIVDIVVRAVATRRSAGPKAARGVLRHGAVPAIVLALGFAIPYGLYFAWRYNYFGRVWPNSVYCKSIYDGDPWALINGFWSVAWPAFGLAVAGLLTMWRRLDVRLLVPILAVTLYIIVYYNVEPIISRMNRHFLTALALLLVVATVGLLRLMELVARRIPTRMRELAIALWLIVGTSPFLSGEHLELKKITDAYAVRMGARERLGYWLDAHLSSEQTFMIGDAGMVPYVARTNVIDAYCLNSAAMTSPSINHSSSKFIDYVLRRRPAMIVIHSVSQDKMIPHTYLNVFPLLLRREAFATHYDHVYTEGDGSTSYWVFERHDH